MSVELSVIIPVFNVERYLRECLDSVLAQTFRDIEVICVDDGSSDSSPSILADYSVRDGRVKVVHGSHEGAYRSRERAAAVAQGEYLHFMDADDLLKSPLVYARAMELCHQNDLDQLVFTAENFVDGEGSEFENLKQTYDRYYHLAPSCCGKVMNGRKLFESLVASDSFFVSPPLRLVRRSLFAKGRVPVSRALYHGDSYYGPIGMYLSEKAMAVNEVYYRRRLRPSSITTGLGNAHVHFKSILEVLIGLVQFEPFARDAADPASDAASYLETVVEAMAFKSRGLDVETTRKLFLEATNGLDVRDCAILSGLFLPVFKRVRDETTFREPEFVPTIRNCAAYIYKRLLQRACALK